MLQSREDAILSSVNRLLAEKGFDAMTMDDVAADVGIAKASLYKHFPSKEQLAAEAMIRVLGLALAATEQLGADRPALDCLKEITRWALRLQLAGEMPSLPAQNSALRGVLMAHPGYLDRLMQLSERLGEWIATAQSRAELDPALPPEILLYTLFARACDPVLPLLKAAGNYEDAAIVEMLVSTCFDGLAGGAAQHTLGVAAARA